MNLVGTTGIAEMLGVSRQRANQIANTKGFPKRLDGPPPPYAKPLASGPVWKRETVERWAIKNGRNVARLSTKLEQWPNDDNKEEA